MEGEAHRDGKAALTWAGRSMASWEAGSSTKSASTSTLPSMRMNRSSASAPICSHIVPAKSHNYHTMF